VNPLHQWSNKSLIPTAHPGNIQVPSHTNKMIIALRYEQLQHSLGLLIQVIVTFFATLSWRAGSVPTSYQWRLDDYQSELIPFILSCEYPMRKCVACRSFIDHKCPPIISDIQGYFVAISHTLTALYIQDRGSRILKLFDDTGVQNTT
jgi:hypothetical protein